MEQQNQLFQLLKEVKRKLWLQKTVHRLYTVLLIGAAIGLVWIGLSRLFVILYVGEKIAISFGLLMIGFVIYVFVKKPTNLDAAKKFDQHGLDDRVLTAMHFSEDTSPVASLQRKDTLTKMKQVLPVMKQEKIHVLQWKKLLILCSMVLLAYLGIAFPNDVRQTAKDTEEELEIVNESKEKLEQFAEEHKEDAGKQAEEKVDKLMEDMKQEKKAAELQEDVLRAEKQLNKLKEQAKTSQQQLNKMAEQLANKGLNKLAEATKQMNAGQMHSQMTKLQEQLNDLEKGDLQALQKKLQSAADMMGMDSHHRKKMIYPRNSSNK
ncbi:AAA family ATPase [Lentibacillus cibarius]|uniref:DUF4175 domain-containing protein n=1 Tax=Lentibacillus cibarius TaxID=2583219 RepID=A0A5S3QN28_9BACI|nr:hypothetical protein [Lentibacillus cibarius]TMN23215.1 hypothetical protein FFL34_14790 [Lentibacillus cibarius]